MTDLTPEQVFIPIEGIPVEAQLEIIEDKFYQEAALYGLAKALGERKDHLVRCDALLDAHAIIKDGGGYV